MMDKRATWQASLEREQQALGLLEESATEYTSLSIPLDLVLDMEAKRRLVSRLEALLAGKSKPFPGNFPPRAPFFGREKEIALALEALDPQDRSWGLLITGSGGIGKTALAVELAYLCLEQARFDTFLFSSANQLLLGPSGEEKNSDATPSFATMLGDIARALDYPGVAQAAGVEKRSGLPNTLRDPNQHILLILDNLETLSPEEQRATSEFLGRLPTNCKVIATSHRFADDSVGRLRLEKLGWPAARQLIEDQAARTDNLRRALELAGPQRWQELYNAVDGSPLALRWTLDLMSELDLSLDRVLDLLHQRAGDDPFLHASIYHEARRELGADDWRVLGALSTFYAPASFEALTSITDLTRMAQESALDRLHAFSLVNVLGIDGSYTLHPRTRQLVKEELARQAEKTSKGMFND